MLNHLFYQNSTTFGDYILVLKKIISSDDFIAISEKKIAEQIAINHWFMSELQFIAIELTIYRPGNRDIITDFAAILTIWEELYVKWLLFKIDIDQLNYVTKFIKLY